MSVLFSRQPTDIVICDGQEAIKANQFAQQVISVSHYLDAQFPTKKAVINICSDRLNFIRTFFAVIEAHKYNLLPPNKQIATITDLAQQHPDSIVIHDGNATIPRDVKALDVRDLSFDTSPNNDKQAPSSTAINPEQLAALSYTSGSSGESQAIKKSWSVLLKGAEINARNMLIGAPDNLHMLSTVPPQHMYGLELSVFLPFVSNVCTHNGQPLLPAQIQKALAAMPAPRALVSTPQHLKALIDSGLNFPEVARLYSATAPLPQQLAKQVESEFRGELVEIYGCSEIGSMARRRTAVEDNWTPFDVMRFTFGDDKTPTFVSAPHVNEPVELQDILKPANNNGFSLHGRVGDMINIAGMRGSLNQINQRLLATEGVKDGIVFMPDASDSNHVQRLAALVVSDTLDRQSLTQLLKQHLHTAFIPRPILFVNELPRSDTSKLPRSAVLSLFEQLTTQSHSIS